MIVINVNAQNFVHFLSIQMLVVGNVTVVMLKTSLLPGL
jgi:hypothetical protein